MPRQLIRLGEVRKSDSFDDQKSQAEIQDVEAAGVTDQDVLEAVISQIRNILGTADWKDPPARSIADIVGSTFRLSAKCLPTDLVGNFVFISGPPVGANIQVETVDIADAGKMPALGMIIGKTSATDCLIQFLGETPTGVSSGLTAGKVHFVGPTGKPSAAAPSGPGQFVQKMGIALGPARLLLVPDFNMVRRG